MYRTWSAEAAWNALAASIYLFFFLNRQYPIQDILIDTIVPGTKYLFTCSYYEHVLQTEQLKNFLSFFFRLKYIVTFTWLLLSGEIYTNKQKNLI